MLGSTVVTLRQASSWVQEGSAALVQYFYTDSGGIANTAWALPFSPALHFRALTNTSVCALNKLSLFERYTHIDI